MLWRSTLAACRRENARLVAALDRCRHDRDAAEQERDAVVLERDEWAKQAGKDRDLAEAARRELETERGHAEMSARAKDEAVATGQRREKQAADLLDQARAVLSP